MLQLQLRSLLPRLPKKNIFFVKLVLFSFLIHCIFFMLLLMTQSFFSSDVIRLSEISDGSMVILMPLMKTISPAVQQPTVVKKIASLPSKKLVQKKTVQLPVMPKKTIPVKKNSTQNKSKILPKMPEKLVPKKTIPKIIPKKELMVKKNEKLNEAVVKKDEIKKVEPVINSSSAIQEVGRYDLELIALCNEIKEGIAKAWKRPANISALTECHVKVCVHSETNRDVAIVQSSQALALDIMVKNFVLSYPFPKTIWHKDIELIF